MIVKFGVAALALATSTLAHAANVESHRYGTTADGRQVDQITLTNDSGVTVKFLTLGGIITDITVPDRSGKSANVVLGYGSFDDYQQKERKNFFGALIGRYAGRIGNARFGIDGQEVRLEPNDGPNALHGGGKIGFESRIWNARTFSQDGGIVGAVLSYTSPAGEQGFPGTLKVDVTYRLLPDNAFRIDYAATTDAPTALNLTNHSYFNLAGAGSGSVGNQRLQIFGSRYVATDRGGIPTGELPPVANTPLDFSAPTPLNTHWDVHTPPMTPMGGFNHSWLFDKPVGEMGAAAVLEDPASGRRMEVFTTEPSMQVYTGDYIDGKDAGAQGVVYKPRDGVALETQHLSDAPNKLEFASTILRPGETFQSATVFRFSTAP